MPRQALFGGRTDPAPAQRVGGASERIHLTGLVSYQELLSLVGHAHALIMPSLYKGFGLPPIEAMAAGIPVAVARAASLPAGMRLYTLTLSMSMT